MSHQEIDFPLPIVDPQKLKVHEGIPYGYRYVRDDETIKFGDLTEESFDWGIQVCEVSEYWVRFDPFMFGKSAKGWNAIRKIE